MSLFYILYNLYQDYHVTYFNKQPTTDKKKRQENVSIMMCCYLQKVNSRTKKERRGEENDARVERERG